MSKQYMEIEFYNPRAPWSRSIINPEGLTVDEIEAIRVVSARFAGRNEVKIRQGYGVRCSWCEDKYGVSPYINLSPAPGSHGICPVCAKIEMDKLEGRE